MGVKVEFRDVGQEGGGSCQNSQLIKKGNHSLRSGYQGKVRNRSDIRIWMGKYERGKRLTKCDL